MVWSPTNYFYFVGILSMKYGTPLDRAHQCCGKVWMKISFARQRQCDRNGTVQREGKWYCASHDPEAIAKRKAASEIKWKQKFEYDRVRIRLSFAAPKLLAACEAALPWLQQRGNEEIVKQVEEAIKEART